MSEPILIRFPDDLAEWLRSQSSLTGESMTAIVGDAVAKLRASAEATSEAPDPRLKRLIEVVQECGSDPRWQALVDLLRSDRQKRSDRPARQRSLVFTLPRAGEEAQSLRWNPFDEIRKATIHEQADIQALAFAMCDPDGLGDKERKREAAFAAAVIRIALGDDEALTMRSLETLEQELHESFRRTLSLFVPN